MNELVERLSKGDHPVAMQRCKDAHELKEMLERDFALVKFTGTRGGTEVAFDIDKSRSRLDADFETPRGNIHLEGELVLNYERVRMIAEVDVETRKGTGHLEPIVEKSTDAA